MLSTAIWLCLATQTLPNIEPNIDWNGFENERPSRETEIKQAVTEGEQNLIAFFGHPTGPIQVRVFQHRAQMDNFVKAKWKMEPTQKWMVAAAGSRDLVILSPDAWKTEAVEHNPNSASHIREIIAHELVHSYHAQHNPSRDFDGMDDMGWFVEGLATLASGQLAKDHKGDVAKVIQSNAVPKALADAWSGRYRYGVCGSMAQFAIDKVGKRNLPTLLVETTNTALLAKLHLTEAEFLSKWQESQKLP